MMNGPANPPSECASCVVCEAFCGEGASGKLAEAGVGEARLACQLPVNSINFVTCHDGFTLNDLVSYNEKHNEANGEGNRDGTNDNAS